MTVVYQRLVDGELVDLKPEEIAQVESDSAENAEQRSREEADAQAAAAARAAAEQKLAALGLTAEDLRLLLGPESMLRSDVAHIIPDPDVVANPGVTTLDGQSFVNPASDSGE